MIYLISNQRSLFKTDLYEELSFDKAKKYLESLSIIEFDTETSGLDPHTKELLTYQLGNREKQFVFDHSSYPIGLFKELFESDRLFLIHNAKFDLKWLYKYDIWPKNIYDTMLAEQVIWLGWGDFRKGIESWEYEDNGYKWPYLVSISDKGNTIYKFSAALQAVSKNRLNLELDKSIRGQITKVGLTPEVIQYAGTDVAHLEDIKESQKVDIVRENLQKAVQLENEFVKCLAYMEFCGVKLDENKWKAKMAKDSAKREEAIKELNDFVINYFNSHKGNIISKTIEAENIIDSQWIHDEEKIKKYGFNFGKISKNQIKETNPKLKEKQYYTRDSGIKEVGLLYCERILTPFPWIQQDLQGDLWNGYNTEPYCTINWSSPKQVIPFLELIGFHLDSFDKKTKKRKKSTDAKTIKSQKSVCPEFAASYIKYKEAAKVCSAFGENWLKAINSKTKRIHADYHQLGTDTARLSSGGGDSAVNCQQIPKDAETRACFVAEKGNCWISEDYDS